MDQVKGYGAFIKFKKARRFRLKAASSYISAEQALITLNKRTGKDKNLEVTKARGQKTWNEVLNRIVVEGCTDEQMKTFYSCLFRANLFSHKFYERKKKMVNRIIIAHIMVRFMMVTCILIMDFGIHSVLNFL